MLYRALGLMSGSSLDGLDVCFAEFEVLGANWNYRIVAADCYAYNEEWMQRLQQAPSLSARDYMQLHADYGHLLGQMVQQFIAAHELAYKVQLIGSHGHTTFHAPGTRMTHQLGDGAALAATTGIHVVSDLRAVDVALGGQGAPIVPIGEKLLFPEYRFFLNLGGIANISVKQDVYCAYDVCPANRVLNLLAQATGAAYDAGGALARQGTVYEPLLQQLNALPYYAQPYPKSLANEFGTHTVYPLIQQVGISTADALRTMVEHIAQQIQKAVTLHAPAATGSKPQMLITGGGAFNTFLVERIQALLPQVTVVIPDAALVQYKEAMIMALMAVLRWREETNVLHTVTGARRSSVGGAIWMGQEW
ncbi:MAG: anhydro-N-acetylmuramic acid kinase [Lacibacter sp.]